ncbi:site-specific tyrosine recombinase XerD [Streptococcus halotolerans]|uniref:site-specific tyrosine recombinase XerD n=1 Tax=Streptococcus halotolerans TaxID=1814128 RepID=UPI000786E481|nr:site-specific tyrosine recombinase XerD [Streptococcus halotolerans]
MITKETITSFLAEKNISAASQKSYSYDLEQFMDLVEGHISDTSLLYYQEFLKSLKVSVQKRKQSSVNQFLHYLYEEGHVDYDYRLKKVKAGLPAPKGSFKKVDLDFLTEDSKWWQGRLIASFLALMGLTLKEMAEIKGDRLDVEFKVLKVKKDDQVRILHLPKTILQQLPQVSEDSYLFDNKGKAYSRQWFFLQLKAYLDSLNLSHLTAQKLRQQYILSQIVLGKSATEIAKQLGLKSSQTLEKYFK